MKQEFVKPWLDALRSGEYKQGSLALRRISDFAEPDRFCCLGVLCDVLIKDGSTDCKWDDLGFIGIKSPTWTNLPLEIIDLVDMKGGYVRYQDTIQSLESLNDHHRLSFNQIADLIEEQWEQL
jgi:hypothetical protein